MKPTFCRIDCPPSRFLCCNRDCVPSRVCLSTQRRGGTHCLPQRGGTCAARRARGSFADSAIGSGTTFPLEERHAQPAGAPQLGAVCPAGHNSLPPDRTPTTTGCTPSPTPPMASFAHPRPQLTCHATLLRSHLRERASLLRRGALAFCWRGFCLPRRLRRHATLRLLLGMPRAALRTLRLSAVRMHNNQPGCA